MKKMFVLLLLATAAFSGIAFADDEAIKKELSANLARSAELWNKGDLEGYMAISYPKREDILMQSANSRTYGYQKIHDMYAKLFPDEAARGVLSFSEVSVAVLAPETVMEIGKFTLNYKDGKKRSGYFTAILKKFPDGWKIIHDHS